MTNNNLENGENALPNWRLAVQGAMDQASNPNTAAFIQLATIGRNGKPKVRTMVWRGFTHYDECDGSAMLMATDLRSDKISELDDNAHAQVVWYFTGAREQFRFTGSIECLRDDSIDQAERMSVWDSMSERARLAFFDITGHGATHEDSDKRAIFCAKKGEPSINFGVLKMAIAEVDHLNLMPQPNQRSRYVIENKQWVCRSISL